VGDAVLCDWFTRNYDKINGELQDISPLRYGLPFPFVFSEVWHYVFGFASKTLAEESLGSRTPSGTWAREMFGSEGA
jgi:hypothetical protein